MMLHGAFLAFQNGCLLTEEGTIDTDLREAITAAIVGVQSLPGMERYWRQRRSYLHSGFAEYVDQLLLQETVVTVDFYIGLKWLQCKRPNWTQVQSAFGLRIKFFCRIATIKFLVIRSREEYA
jgi:hypothetical protein